MRNQQDNNLEVVLQLQRKEILNFKEATLYLGLSQPTLYGLTSSKRIPFSKPNNGRIYFSRKALDGWLLQGSDPPDPPNTSCCYRHVDK